MDTKTLLKDHAVYQYILDHSLCNPPILTKMYQQAMNDEHNAMVTAPDQIQFLALLVKMLNASNVLEIGVFRGVGTLGMALALPTDGVLHGCDITDEYLSGYQSYWQQAGVSEKIKLHIGPAIDTLNQFILDGQVASFDFVYIDADKENYLLYYQLAYQLLRTGGVMVIDNVLWSGHVADSSDKEASTIAIRALNDYVHADNRVAASLLPVGDGINIIHKL